MAVTLTLTGKRPNNTQFGLDSFTEIYKCDATADVVLTDAGVPAMGSVHPDYEFMFVVSRYVNESSESASALDLTYMGCLLDDGAGNPTLPDDKLDDSDAIASASSSRGLDGSILTSPVTVQYYAPTKTLAFFTYNAEGSLDTVADPTANIRVVSITSNDTSYTPTGILSSVVTNFFTELIVDTITSTPIVVGKFWLNTETKTKTLTPFLFTITAGEYVAMYSPGQDYVVGDSLSFTDGTFTATLTVDSVGGGNSIRTFTVTSNSFNYSTTIPLFATGGSGTGAGFWNVHIA